MLSAIFLSVFYSIFVGTLFSLPLSRASSPPVHPIAFPLSRARRVSSARATTHRFTSSAKINPDLFEKTGTDLSLRRSSHAASSRPTPPTTVALLTAMTSRNLYRFTVRSRSLAHSFSFLLSLTRVLPSLSTAACYAGWLSDCTPFLPPPGLPFLPAEHMCELMTSFRITRRINCYLFGLSFFDARMRF